MFWSPCSGVSLWETKDEGNMRQAEASFLHVVTLWKVTDGAWRGRDAYKMFNPMLVQQGREIRSENGQDIGGSIISSAGIVSKWE